MDDNQDEDKKQQARAGAKKPAFEEEEEEKVEEGEITVSAAASSSPSSSQFTGDVHDLAKKKISDDGGRGVAMAPGAYSSRPSGEVPAPSSPATSPSISTREKQKKSDLACSGVALSPESAIEAGFQADVEVGRRATSKKEAAAEKKERASFPSAIVDSSLHIMAENNQDSNRPSGHLYSGSTRNLPLAAEVHPDDDPANKPPTQLDVNAAIQEFLCKAPTAQATTLEPQEEHPSSQQKCFSRKNLLLGLLGLLVIVGAAVAVVLTVGGGGSAEQQVGGEDEETNEDSSNVPTVSATTSAPTTFLDSITSLVAAYSEAAVIEDGESPQFFGLQWLVADSSAGEWDDDALLERYGLATLYYATRSIQWTSVTDFLLPLSHCDWDGVECDENQNPPSLALASQNLDGVLPKEIGLLTSLTSIDLVGNSITGVLPSEIGFLTSLQSLNIGGLPEPVNRGRSLEDGFSLGGDQNHLTGTIPSEIGQLTDLTALYLQEMGLTGSIPSEIQFLTKLGLLHLNKNKLQGLIPVQLGALAGLSELALERNELSGDVPNVFCSSISVIEELSSDCLHSSDGTDSEVNCRCCSVCCDRQDTCVDLDVTAFPSSHPSASPSNGPSPSPSGNPSLGPSPSPSSNPTSAPSPKPTEGPTLDPTLFPTGAPTSTIAPTTSAPTTSPSQSPTNSPSMSFKPSSLVATPEPTSCIHPTSCQNGQRVCQGAIPGLCTEQGSCNGKNACRGAAFSCVGDSACASLSGSVENNSCTSDSACATSTTVQIASSSCTGRNSCSGIQAGRRSSFLLIGSGSCQAADSCTGFVGNSIDSNACNCEGCCSCNNSGDLPEDIPSNSCNRLGECCSTPSPTASPTKRPTLPPTQRPTFRPTTPRPTALPTKQPTPVPTPMPTVGYVNSFPAVWDISWTNRDQDFTRSYGGRFMCGVSSTHANQQEDRSWKFKWCSSPYDGLQGNEHVTGYVNNWDAPFTFTCPSNRAMTRIHSTHSNDKEDRRWSFACESIRNSDVRDCVWTGYVNGWDGQMHQDYAWSGYNPNRAVIGISSYHHNQHEDRQFKFQICRVFKKS